jgi:hypothetical protein
MFLAEVGMFLGASFLGDSGRRLSTRTLVSFLTLVGSFLIGLYIGPSLGTFALDSLQRHMKQPCVHGSHIFLVKVDLILPCMWAHPKSVTLQISLSQQYIHGNCTGLGAQAVVPAEQLHSVEVELFYMLHELTHAVARIILEHVCDVVPLLLSRVVGKHSEKVEHHAVIE